MCNGKPEFEIFDEQMDAVYEVLKHWFSAEILSVEPVAEGVSCQTYALRSAGGKYMLRGFPTQRQAEQEYAVSVALAGTGVGAEIVKTRDGESYVRQGETYYNLQVFLPGISPNLGEREQIRAAGKALASLHDALTKCDYPFSRQDRFSTISLLRQTEGQPLPDSLFPDDRQTLGDRTIFLLELEKNLSQNQIIHGDLGDWNMLWDGTQMRIIDFGECRFGDQHFDLAAVICCILSKCKNRNEFAERMGNFMRTYESGGGYVDAKKLHIAVYLWLVRGALASAALIREQAAREKACERFAQDIEKYMYDVEWKKTGGIDKP